MSKGIARVTIVGNLTRDPDIRNVNADASSVCELGIAVNGSKKVQGQWEEYASYFDVIVWGKQAESCAQYLTKGRQVAVDGRLEQQRWQDKETGGNRSKVVVIADTVMFIGGEGKKRDDFNDIDFGDSLL